MSANLLIIRADASALIGTGHVMRMLALAQGWRRAGGETRFALADATPALVQRLREEGFELARFNTQLGGDDDAAQTIALARQYAATFIVADGYHFGADFQRAIKKAGLRLLLVDDYGHAEHYYADLILNQNLHANERLYTSREPHSRLLLGTRYVQLRQQFLAYRDWTREIPTVARKVLVTLGGGDPDNVTGKVIEALHGLDVEAKIVVGGSNPHLASLKADARKLTVAFELIADANNMPELMAWADVVVSAGGTTSYETAFMGLPNVVTILADNQADTAAALEREGVSVNLGRHTQVTVEKIAEELQSLLKDRARRESMSRRGRELADGEGVVRVVSALRRSPLQITIASDEGSWLNEHLSAFIAQLSYAGHTIKWVHKAAEIGNGDLCLLLSFGQIVSGDVLKRHKHNLVVHESDLPHGRGWSPLTWQILEGKNEIPVRLLEAEEAVDSGPIYGQTMLHFTGLELIDELRAAQARATFELCHAFLEEYPESANRGRPQVGEPSYYSRRRPTDSQLDPNKTLAEQFNLLRVVDNERYPAFFEHQGHRYVLKVEKQA